MALNSLKFLAFIALVALVYYLVPKKIQWSVLLVASSGFYIVGGVDIAASVKIEESTQNVGYFTIEKLV